MNYKLFWILIIVALFAGCQKELEDQEIYKRPSWLEGKLFTQIQTHDDLGTFMECLERTGYDTIINVSGSFTIFAPTDEAFEEYFAEHPDYDSVSQVPVEELTDLVQYQIIQNAWSKLQLQSLDVDGWIDRESEFYNEPRGFKRETLYREDDKTYYVTYSYEEGFNIVEQSNQTKKVYSGSRKYVPLFFAEYFDVADFTFSDYEFYFDRPFENGEIFVAGAKVISEEIFAENGFIYKTDKVNEPLKDAEEIMEQEDDDFSYSEFLSLIHEFADFTFNPEATFAQEAYREGLSADSLFDLTYPGLAIDIHDEVTGENPISSIRYHGGMIAPTDEAFEKFLDDFIRGPGRWGDLSRVPQPIKMMLVNSHMSTKPIYKTNLDEGFRNGEEDLVRIEENSVVQSTYGSNSTFLGLDKVVVPKAFSCVAQPVYLNPGYSTLLHAIDETKIISALKRLDQTYTFYVPANHNIGLGGDSSLIYEIDDHRLDITHFEVYDRSVFSFRTLSKNDLRGILLNHIGTSIPTGNANKEFIRTLGGSYITVDNVEGTIRGDGDNTYGFNGDSVITVTPQYIDVPVENGEVYNINTWLTFTPGGNFFGVISTEFPEFFELMKKAGLYDEIFFRFPFLTEGSYYTAFIPSAEVIERNNLDELSDEELAKLIKYHFIKDELIFTDGKVLPGSFPTTRLDESSTVYSNIFSTVDIDPGYDEINILDKNGELYYKVEEGGTNLTNMLVKTDTDKSSSSKWDFITTGVIHVIDTVFIKDKMQVN